MSIQRQELIRVFMYAGVRLPDPGPEISPVAARDFFAAAGRPELSSAEVRGPEIVGNEMQYTLHRAVGTKGLETAPSIDLENLPVSGWLTDSLKAFDKGQIKRVPTVNKIASAMLRNDGDGPAITPPACALPWYY